MGLPCWQPYFCLFAAEELGKVSRNRLYLCVFFEKSKIMGCFPHFLLTFFPEELEELPL
jgi:hypothetical protein